MVSFSKVKGAMTKKGEYSENRLLDSPRSDSFTLKMGLENFAIDTGY